MKKMLLILIVGLFSGCGTLIPKRVELFQDKVQKFPEPRSSEIETQRRAADLAERKARETYDAAIVSGATTNVVQPAAETVALTGAVSDSLGPPKKPADETGQEVAAELRHAIAKLNGRIDDFKQGNDENAGKKIENTGLISVPYFLWVALVGVFIFVGLIVAGVLWTFLKMYAVSNPPVQLGVSAVQMGANFLKRALGEVTKGGEAFKAQLAKTVEDPALQEKIKELFRVSQERAQSGDVQEIIKALTRKE
jgi:hypothetical protein